MRSHAIANGVFVAAANRTGVEGQLEFWGASFLADPNGNVLARASHDSEETLLVECDLDKIDVVRTHWPFLRDRRIDAYGDDNTLPCLCTSTGTRVRIASFSAARALISPSRWRDISTLARCRLASLMNGMRKCWPCQAAIVAGDSRFS